tara:strand:- start:306 stop:488 length:183 start_codon:yes stop_codon:yes gene_type:complete
MTLKEAEEMVGSPMIYPIGQIKGKLVSVRKMQDGMILGILDDNTAVNIDLLKRIDDGSKQ